MTHKIIQEWWTRRVAEGSQLSHPQEFIKGWDYKGDGPWFQSVSMHALMVDCCMDTGLSFSSIEKFSTRFRSIALFFRIVNKEAKMRRKDGSLFTKQKRTFVEFGSKPLLDGVAPLVFNGPSDGRDAKVTPTQEN